MQSSDNNNIQPLVDAMSCKDNGPRKSAVKCVCRLDNVYLLTVGCRIVNEMRGVTS